MSKYSRRRVDTLNPYIALSDLTISLILIVVFFVAVGRLGLVNFKYKRAMEDFDKAVHQLPDTRRPRWERGRNDPPGVQRWVFDGRSLFAKTSAAPQTGSDLAAQLTLTPEGHQSLAGFAALLQRNSATWRRIRVEGHTRPPLDNELDDWELSARRAAIVVRQIQVDGRIPPYRCAVAGRAGQNPLFKLFVFTAPNDPSASAARAELTARGLTFSLKNASSPEARGLRQKFGISGGGFIAGQEQDGNDLYEAARTDTQRNSLIERYQQNERVEVLIEYTQQGK